ncbi:acyltransferase domain-containing protein [Mariniluteicoccus flavus]
MLAIVAPGQGAQTPGFLTPWLEDPRFRARLEWLSAVSGIDLIHYGTEADADTIRDTAIAQPLLVASGMVAALALFPSPAEAFRVVGVGAGHSVGEITAAAAAGALSAEQAMVLVRERGAQMAAASAATPTSMTAVIGGDAAEVLAALDKHGLTAANNNGAGQVVAAGTVEQLAALAADPPHRARLVPLSVAGAFHTVHMAPAVAHLERLSAAITTHDPRVRLLSNADGAVVSDGGEVLRRIVAQVANPVRWDLCMETMLDLGVTGLLELPPAGTLTGIAKRNLKGVETFALKTPDQIHDAIDFVQRHGEPSTPSALYATPTWRLVVSPGKGHFTPTEGIVEGAVLPPGAAIGTVATLRDESTVTTPHGGTLTEWLVEDGDPVAPGQPLLRLYPSTENAQATEVSH